MVNTHQTGHADDQKQTAVYSALPSLYAAPLIRHIKAPERRGHSVTSGPVPSHGSNPHKAQRPSAVLSVSFRTSGCQRPSEETLRAPAAAAEGRSATSTAILSGVGELHVLPLIGQSQASSALMCVTGEGPGEESHSRARGAWRSNMEESLLGMVSRLYLEDLFS